jgi:hypothetical protein
MSTIPGFAAEASLYKANRRYRTRASWTGMTRVDVGPAQQFLPIPPGGTLVKNPIIVSPTLGFATAMRLPQRAVPVAKHWRIARRYVTFRARARRLRRLAVVHRVVASARHDFRSPF